MSLLDRMQIRIIATVAIVAIAAVIGLAVFSLVHSYRVYDKVSTACLELDPNATILQPRGAILCVLSDGRVIAGLDK